MRTILLISAAAVLLGACQKKPESPGAATATGSTPAPALPSLSTSPPPHKVGLWTQSMTQDGKTNPVGPMKICIDQAYDQRMHGLAERMGAKDACQQSFTRNLDGTYAFSSTCKKGEVGTVASKGTISGDFSSTYNMHIETDISGSAMPAMDGHHVMEMDATYGGACPAGMSGGDMMLANGMVINGSKAMGAAGMAGPPGGGGSSGGGGAPPP